MAILAVVYVIAGYWAVNKVFYENKVVIYSDGFNFFINKLGYALVLGWALIPIAILKSIFSK